MNADSARQAHPEIFSHLSGETTEELLRAWRDNDRTMWVPEAFEVMRALLTERLGHAPSPQGAPRADVDDELDPDIDEIAAPTAGRESLESDAASLEPRDQDANDDELYGDLLDRLAERFVCPACGHQGGEAESGGPAHDYAFVACEVCGATAVFKLSVIDRGGKP